MASTPHPPVPKVPDLENKIGSVIAFASKIIQRPLYDEQRLPKLKVIPSGLLSLSLFLLMPYLTIAGS
jgi:hypothetical protein